MGKTVFILGAGASKQAGAPLMSEFVARARDLESRSGDDGPYFKKVFRAIRDLRQLYFKSYVDPKNIEDIFGAFEMGRLIGRFGDYPTQEIDALVVAIKRVIVKTLELSIVFSRHGEVIMPAHPYPDFISIVKALTARDGDSACSILTFNYDIAIDFGLYLRNMAMDYCLTGSSSTPGLKLLKLHGSVNWGKCSGCGSVVPWQIADFVKENPYGPPEPGGRFILRIGSNLGGRPHECRGALSIEPLLVPPTWNKTEYHGQLSRVWKDAAQELSEAENIFVIGYSLPESDLFFKYLFALGTIGDVELRRLWVVNPDEALKARYDAIVGPGIESYEFLPEPFDQAIPKISHELDIRLR
jgi:hypothetical protein